MKVSCGRQLGFASRSRGCFSSPDLCRNYRADTPSANLDTQIPRNRAPTTPKFVTPSKTAMDRTVRHSRSRENAHILSLLRRVCVKGCKVTLLFAFPAPAGDSAGRTLSCLAYYQLSSRAPRGIWVFACAAIRDGAGKNLDPSLGTTSVL